MENGLPEIEPVDVPGELALILDEAQLLSNGDRKIITDIDSNLLITSTMRG